MDLFDIVGPVMIGPSSSHTAGAARIGRITRQLLGEEVVTADIAFHGSFAKTWRGHGTDRAILGGLMGMEVDDERLRNSRQLADRSGLRYTLRTVFLGDAHANSVLLCVQGQSGKSLCVQAASLGGGRISVEFINGLEAGFSGDYPTLVVGHQDSPGVISEVTRCVSQASINIGTMRAFRSRAGGEASMVLELDGLPPAGLLDSIRALPHVLNVTMIDRL